MLGFACRLAWGKANTGTSELEAEASVNLEEIASEGRGQSEVMELGIQSKRLMP